MHLMWFLAVDLYLNLILEKNKKLKIKELGIQIKGILLKKIQRKQKEGIKVGQEITKIENKNTIRENQQS